MNGEITTRFGIRAVADFCIEHDPRGQCCGGWPRDLLEIHLRYYHNFGSVFLVRRDEQLVGVGIGWRCDERDLGRHWAAWKGCGDCFYISDVVCSEGTAVQTLVDGLSSRCPDWRSLKLFAQRKGRIRRIGVKFMEKLNGRKEDEQTVS